MGHIQLNKVKMDEFFKEEEFDTTSFFQDKDTFTTVIILWYFSCVETKIGAAVTSGGD
jgi:hypothetical protein